MPQLSFRCIFAYYIIPNDIYNVIYKYHLANLAIRSNLKCFNNIDFYLLIDDINDVKTIDKVKEFILSFIGNETKINNCQINFYVNQNNDYYREGNIFYNYIVNKLDQYANNNEIIFFAHTKGLTNKNLDNTFKWINLLYDFNLDIGYFEAKNKLVNSDYDHICAYGAIYNYSESLLNKYKWIFYGGFSWINPKRLLKYIKDYNIDYLSEFSAREIYKKTCAESFLPNILPVNRIAFYQCERYNLYNDTIKYEGKDFPYNKIQYIASLHITPKDMINHYDYCVEINNFILKDEITNDL